MDITLSIWMITYNHENYITRALEGVVMQKTNFKFDLIVGEDCSTDNTRLIIKKFEKKYPEIIKPIYHEKNIGGRRNAYEFVLPKCTGKYIACLEGDDYWTDPNKLQKQVDFLEANPDYSICWTKYRVLPLNGEDLNYSEWVEFIDNKDRFEVNLDNFCNPYVTHTLTTVFKREALNLALLEKMKYTKDYTVFCMCLSIGKGAVLNFFGAVYRLHSNGAFTKLSPFNKCYSSYLTMREIIQFIPNCHNKNLVSERNRSLLLSFEVSVFNKAVGLRKNLDLYFKVLFFCKVQEKIRATKIVLKQLYGMRRFRRASPGAAN